MILYIINTTKPFDAIIETNLFINKISEQIISKKFFCIMLQRLFSVKEKNDSINKVPCRTPEQISLTKARWEVKIK